MQVWSCAPVSNEYRIVSEKGLLGYGMQTQKILIGYRKSDSIDTKNDGNRLGSIQKNESLK
jgi:hypothetical protein